MQIQGNQQNFNGSYRMYFYTNDGKRIVSDENMKKCLHYVEAQLNGSKRVKEPNKELIDTFKFGQVDKKTGQRVGGDRDYFNLSKIRAVFRRQKDRKDGFINIVTGKDAIYVDEKFGKNIGRAKRTSIERLGNTDSFETSYAVGRYFDNAVDYAENMRKGDRAFGVAFTPEYYTKGQRKGELKGFTFHHAGFFNEKAVNPNSPTI